MSDELEIPEVNDVEPEDLAKIDLPPIHSVEEFSEIAAAMERPDELIEDILLMCCILMLVGPSKMRKSWTLLSLAFAFYTGGYWLGKKVVKCNSLLIDFELQAYGLNERIDQVSEKYFDECNNDFAELFIWLLRGKSVSLKSIKEQIITFCLDNNVKVVIFDPIYKLLQFAGCENSAKETGIFMSDLSEIAERAGVAIIFSHHTAKGDASARSSIDRASGSGVFGRHPDAIITMNPHEEDDSLIVETVLRYFKPLSPFVVTWENCNWELDDQLHPEDYKTPRRSGQKRQKGPEDILRLIPSEPKPKADVTCSINLSADIGINRVSQLISGLIANGQVIETQKPIKGRKPMPMIHRAETNLSSSV